MLLASVESTNHETIQLPLQLNEPGTLWCAATALSTGPYCSYSELQHYVASDSCYFETYIKGRALDGTVFRADVHQAYRDVDIEVNRIWEKDMVGSAALAHQTPYHIFCFAEDDWRIEAELALSNSP